jgi:hypothetical protein
MGYRYKGERPTPTYTPILDDNVYTPFSESEIWAKFAYFRKAEAGINGGPAPIYSEPEQLKPLKLRDNIPECGTYSGYARHIRLKNTPCRLCLNARGDYQRGYRARKSAA